MSSVSCDQGHVRLGKCFCVFAWYRAGAERWPVTKATYKHTLPSDTQEVQLTMAMPFAFLCFGRPVRFSNRPVVKLLGFYYFKTQELGGHFCNTKSRGTLVPMLCHSAAGRCPRETLGMP